MIAGKPISITGVGKYLPQAISSAQLEEEKGIPKGWSEKYSGVESRHMVSHESNGYMAAKAVEKALEHAKVKGEQVDMLISASVTFDYPLPSQASVIKSELGNALPNPIPTVDINSSCLSFISAFEMAAGLLDGKQYKTIVIVSSEIASKGLDYSNWETATLFGDGAAAVVLQYDTTGESIFMKASVKTYSEGVYDSMIKGGGSKYFFRDFPFDSALHCFSMKGKKLLRLAQAKTPEFVKVFFEDQAIELKDVNVIIPHQASKAGISIFEKLYHLFPNQLKTNLSDHGNCIAASIPMVLHDTIQAGELKRGDLCLLIGTAAGFSVGGVLIRY